MNDRERINKIEELKKMATEWIKQRNYERAVDIAEQILVIDAESCEGLYFLALCYMQQGSLEEASSIVNRIISMNVEYLGAYVVQAHIEKQQNKIDEEINILQKITDKFQGKREFSLQELRIYSEACSLLGSAYTLLGEAKRARQYFFTASQVEPLVRQKIIEYSNFLFTSNYDAAIENSAMLIEHKQYNTFFDDVKRYVHHERKSKDKVRIGYISPDFRRHAVAFFSYALLTEFDRDTFEIICYASGKEDDITALLQHSVNCWRNINALTTDETAQLIYDDGIDILVDLAGHTANNHLPVLARKPAPVQISGIGYFNTTGLKEIDYFLTDIHCDPVGQNDVFFSEKLLRLPHSHFCYTAIVDMPDCAGVPCVRNGYVTFGCFNNFSKITDETLRLWKKILTRLPQAKLILKSKVFGSVFGRESAVKRFILQGIEPQRIELRPITKAYLHEYHDVDIALDPYPYPGGATTCEALYMGVPVVTLAGVRHGARFGYSILKNAGLEELIAKNETEYVEKALALAADEELLQTMRGSLRPIMQKSTLMNQRCYLTDVEAAYKEIWREKQNKLSLQEKLIQRDFSSMIPLLQEMLKESPNNEDLLSQLAGACIESGKAKEAEIVVEKLIELYPENIFFSFLQARVQYMKGDLPLVIALLEQAVVKETPSRENEVKSLIYNLLANSYGLLGIAQKSAEYYRKASMYSVDEEGKAIDYSNYLFHLHYLPQISQQELFMAHCEYQKIFQEVRPYVHERRQRRERLRIGYLSPDLREHVVTFFSYALFLAYDRERFSVVCFSSGREDYISERIRSLTDGWFSLKGMSADQAAQVIYAQGIDILVDLSGHTKNNCLPIMVRKPAPIQVCGIGYFDTTGLGCMDYFLTDVYCDAPGQNDAYFSEKLLRLPHSHFCYASLRTDTEISDAPCLKNGYVTFGSFNNLTKINDEVLLVWKEILQQLPDARLILKSGVLGNSHALAIIRQRLAQLGMPLAQVEFRGESYPYMQEYNDIDIALDTFPYPGGGTTCDALYMSVPVITLTGERHGARFGYSILKNVGLEELAAQSKEEYIEKAIVLANDKTLLDGLRKNLRKIMIKSDLMDEKRYMCDLEAAYEEIYHQYIKE